VAVDARIEVAVIVAAGFTTGSVFGREGGIGAPASLDARTMGACPRPMAIPKHKGAHFLSIGTSSHA
jgi:hypothetical protein